MRPFRLLTATALCFACLCSPSKAEEVVRVATYNIKFLSTDVVNQGNRLEKLHQVIELLDADVIGLQEIDDRAALELVFPPTEWQLIIDDQSGNNQDVAVAIRLPFQALGVHADLDADDVHFLFGDTPNLFFPNRRDLLSVEVQVPNGTSTFFVMVHHSKSRFEREEGKDRATNDFRREGASERIIQILEQDFHEEDFVLLGDFNDNPDDRSLNILETGDPNAAGGPEEDQGPFLINLTEPLCAEGHVSHGRNSSDITGDSIDTIDSGSRQRNNEARGTNKNTGDILFDQLLVPPSMNARVVEGSVQVFDHAVAAKGNSSNRASDHLPVVAEFVFEDSDAEVPALQIASLLPNPTDKDAGNEEFTLKNNTDSVIDLAGWVLRDRAGNEFALSGTVNGNDDRRIKMTSFSMPLNNSGDEISLIDDSGDVVDHVVFRKEQVQAGVLIVFQ